MADPHLVARYISEELTVRRKGQDLSREDVVAQLAEPVKPRTLASWEHGSRQMTLAQFVAVCNAQAISPVGVLRAAMLRADLNARCEHCGEVRGGG